MNLFSALDLALCVLCAYVGLYTLVFFISDRREIERLHFSLLCFLIALNDVACIGLYNATSVHSGAFWQKMQFFCTGAISIEFLNFTYRLLRRPSDVWKRILLATAGLLFGVGVVLNDHVLDASAPLQRTVTVFGHSVTYYEYKPGLIWVALFGVQLVGMMRVCTLLVREYAWKRKRDVLAVLIGFLLFFAAAAVDILISLNAIVFLYTVEYAFLIMVILMDYVLLRRFLSVVSEVETLNHRLEEKVAERTQEIQSMAADLAAANRSLADRNVALQELSERDSLTKLLNHATFHQRLAELFHMAGRQGFPVSVMLIDIDHFKEINDVHGHQMGDAVITSIAKSLQRGSRDYDVKARISVSDEPGSAVGIAGRYGGDEFAVALAFCGVAESDAIAARTCSMVRALKFEQSPDLRVTASVGCAVLLNHSRCQDELHLVRMADAALYEAKRKGRDQPSAIVIG
jgi:GGDEF domain-containing protein